MNEPLDACHLVLNIFVDMLELENDLQFSHLSLGRTVDILCYVVMFPGLFLRVPPELQGGRIETSTSIFSQEELSAMVGSLFFLQGSRPFLPMS